LAISRERGDFVNAPTPLNRPTTLVGMENDLEIKGIGTVVWTFDANDGTEIQIRTQAYWVPGATARLLSPQKLYNKKQGVFGDYQGDEDIFCLFHNNGPAIEVPYDPRSDLPIGYARTGATPEPQVNVILTDESQNLTSSQNILLDWHNRFAHLNFARIQQVLHHVPFVARKFGDAVKCDHPRCHTYELAKAKRRPKKSTLQTKTTERDGAPKAGNTKVGARVSVDHFESRLLGRTYDSYGKPSSTTFKGGAFFVDHASSFVHCEHQVGFSAVETIRAKQSYERFCMENGVVFQEYLTDSGTFKANQCVSHIHEMQQLLRLCGMNAHHQNGVADRSIQTISNMDRTMIVHASMHWKESMHPLWGC
jgi:hypothetical protein